MEGGTAKVHKKTFGSDGKSLYHNSGGFRSLSVKISLNYML